MSDYNPDEAHLYSIMAQASYLRNRGDRENLLKKNGLEGWNIDNELSDKENTVFTKGDDVVFSIRGTDFSNSSGGKSGDLATDALLSLGLETITPRYRRSKKNLAKAQDKYKDKNIVITGHSLGSRIGIELAKEKGLEAHVFNQGSTVAHNKRGIVDKLLAGNKQKERIHSYHIVGDLISNSSIFDPSITTHILEPNPDVKKTKNPLYYHDLNHFKNTRIS